MSTFTIGNLLTIGANGEGTPGWSYNRIKGWYDVEQDQLDSESRPGQDGSFASDESYSSQAVPTIEGIFVGSSAFEVAQAKMLMRTLKNQGHKLPAIWDDHGMVTRRELFIMRVTPTHSAGRYGFKWAIDMFSSDPGLYGLPVTAGPVGPISNGEGGLRFDEYTNRPASTGVGPGLVFPETYGTPGSDGRLQIVNVGTSPAWTVFTFVGGSSLGFSITKVSTGQRISVEREIPEGAVVKVNPRTGRVTINGTSNDISGSLRDDNWFSTDPGTTDQVQLGILGTPYGSPTLSAETLPAY